MIVASIAPAGVADVYNMEVDDTHDFVVNGGVVVHNCRYMCMSRPVMPIKPVEKKTILSDPLNQFSGRR